MDRLADRAPNRHQDPLRALWLLPRAHLAPRAPRVELLRVAADERRRIERGAVIFAAERIAIEQPDAAFLARPGEELASALVERDRTDVDVEIARAHPVRV